MTDNFGILKHIRIRQRSSFDECAERAKDILIGEVMKNAKDKRMSVQKRVRMSLDAHHVILSPESERNSQRYSQEMQWSGLVKKSDEESLADFLHRRRSSHASNLSSSETRKTNGRSWQNYLMENIHGSDIKIGSRYVSLSMKRVLQFSLNFFSFVDYKNY
jgi:predicted HTH transcriptional regulator